jgi:hypothetical protein
MEQNEHERKVNKLANGAEEKSNDDTWGNLIGEI